MGAALSQERKQLLDAAQLGDVQPILAAMSADPALLKTSTLIKRRNVMHIAASQGHTPILEAVVQPLVDEVKEEVRHGSSLARSLACLPAWTHASSGFRV